MVHDDSAPVSDRSHRVKSVRRHDSYKSRTCHLRVAVDRSFELPLCHVPGFLIGMRVLGNRRARVEDVVPEGHAAGVEITTLPTGEPLDNLQVVSVDECHLLISVRALRDLIPDTI